MYVIDKKIIHRVWLSVLAAGIGGVLFFLSADVRADENSSSKSKGAGIQTDVKKAKKDHQAQKSAMDSSCEQVVSANDMMKFDTKQITIGADCQTFKLTLKHTGRLPLASMGHNLVITEESKADQVIKAGLQAGAAKGYVPDSPDVLAATKLLGGGDTDTIHIDVAKLAGKSLAFFCLFPGHFSMMRGQVSVQTKAKSPSS